MHITGVVKRGSLENLPETDDFPLPKARRLCLQPELLLEHGGNETCEAKDPFVFPGTHQKIK